MKLTLDELKVESYSTQFSEVELTELKGGLAATPTVTASSAGCVEVGVAVIGAIGLIFSSGSDHTHTHCDSTTTTTTSTDECGNTTTTVSTDYDCNNP